MRVHYLSGEETHASDRIQHSGEYGTVVFVSDGEHEEYAPGFEDHLGSEPGVWIANDDGGVTFIGEPDERLTFLDRG